MTRLLLVNAHGTDESRGGAERYVAELARGLPERGFEVSVLSAFPGEHSASVPTTVLHATDWKEDRGRRVRNQLASLSSRPTRRLHEAIARARPDVVHTHNLPGITTAVWEVARRAGVPVVHCLHDYQLLCPRGTLLRADGSPCRPRSPLHELRTRRLARWAGAVSRIHGPSDYIIRRHAGLFRRAEAEVIRHARAQTLQRQLEPAAQRPRTLGFIGALDRTKGVDVLLEALPGLERHGCEVRIAGDGKLRRAVEEAAASHAGLLYLGTLSGSGKDDFFEACDVGVVPSVWPEPAGPPFALLEWLAAGRPAIASRRGGLGESAGLPGVVPIEPTAEELIAAVERLIADDSAMSALTESRNPIDPGDRNRWLGDHERILHEALG